MLSPGEIERLSMAYDEPMRRLENQIMSDIIRRIKENGGEITRAADWQIYRLRELGMAQEDINSAIQDALGFSDEDMEKMYSDVIAKGYAYDSELYKKAGVPRIPFEDNLELQQLISAVGKQTADEFKNITQSLGFAVRNPDGTLSFQPVAKYYQETLDNAVMGIASGVFDYNTVLKKTVTELTNSGLRTVDYASGWSNRVDVAARRAIMTGLSQLTSQVNESNAKELGTDMYEVTWHSGARPTHQVWQGKWYTHQELIDICGLGSVTGLCGANCYHDYYPVIPGISEPTYTQEELDRMNAEENKPISYCGKEYTKYEALQRQRQLERRMRAQKQSIKLLEDGGANEDDILNAKAKYHGISQDYAEFSRTMGLPQQRQRVNVADTPKTLKFVDKSSESGIIKEREKLPRKLKNANNAVDWFVVQSNEYSQKFSKLSDDEKISSAIETRAKWALNNRDGKSTEELYAISLLDGREISRITNQHFDSAVKRTFKFTQKLNAADKAGEKVLLIHNHPKGLPPSISDINALFVNNNVIGITVGHNGSVYKYTKPVKEITESDWSIALRHYKEYSDITSMEKAIEELSKKFKFDFEIL